MESKKREAYNLSAEELKELQEIEIEMMEEIDRVCKKCGIQYCMSAGTQLGAIRHKGFIPWDDDADIAFLRPEYEKFREACETELDKERFYFQDYRNTPGYRWGYGKIRRKGTEFVRLNQEHMPYGQEVFVDIMPYDNVPDAYLSRKWHNFRCFLYRKCFYSEVGRVQEKGIKRIVYKLMSKIPSKWLYDSFTAFTIRSNKKENTKRIRILSIPVPGKEHGYLRSCFENPILTEYEGKMFMGMKDYDSYLSYKYGDYMKLPPVEKREVHPVSKLRLLKAGKRA